MDTWITQAEFERIETDSSGIISIEGGFDTWERVDIRELSEEEGIDVEGKIHIFKGEKRTDIFDLSFRWAVSLSEEQEDKIDDTDELKEYVKSRILSEASYEAAHYLKSMDLPPIQGLFNENMALEMIPDEEESSES